MQISFPYKIRLPLHPVVCWVVAAVDSVQRQRASVVADNSVEAVASLGWHLHSAAQYPKTSAESTGKKGNNTPAIMLAIAETAQVVAQIL